MGKSKTNVTYVIGYSFCLAMATTSTFAIADGHSLGVPSSMGSPSSVILDGTMGTAGSLSGPDYQITEDLGQLRGSNLFHSFSDFNLVTGESATFSGRQSITNVISRVTGNNSSSINGTINSSISGANVYLINPNGVVFGENASLNVGGSFYASTADYMEFSDGGRFDASNPSQTVLTSASPSAFGFLNTSPASIEVDQARLKVLPGESIGLVSGDILIKDASAGVRRNNSGNLLARNGRIELVSVAGPSQVDITTAGIRVDGVDEFGNINLQEGAVLSTNGNPGGSVYIRAGNLVIENSLVTSTNRGKSDHNGAAIDISVQDELRIEYRVPKRRKRIRSIGGIEAAVLRSGKGGDIHINADAIVMQGSPLPPLENPNGSAADSIANISARVIGNGDGGDITISGGRLEMQEYSRISTMTTGAGDAGDISVTAQQVSLSAENGTAEMITSAITPLRTKKRVGNAGDIAVDAGDIVLRGAGNRPVGLFSQAVLLDEPVRSGDIRLMADTLQVLDGAQINAGRSGGGVYTEDGVRAKLGGVNITTDSLVVKGVSPRGYVAKITAGTDGVERGGGIGGDIDIHTHDLLLSDAGRIENTNFSRRVRAGNINIDAKNIDISRSGKILTGLVTKINSTPTSIGDVNITTDTLRIHDADVINQLKDSDGPIPEFVELIHATGIITASAPGTRRAGDINVKTGTLELLDGGEINATTWSQSRGGRINIEADDILLSGSNAERNIASRIISASENFRSNPFTDNAGNINIKTGNLTLNDGAEITAISNSVGDAGNIIINASNNILLTDAKISSSALQSADGGNITVNAINILHLTDSQISASVSGGGGGNGGNVNIDPIFVILDGSAITANAVGGSGGNINIIAENFIASPDSSINASSKTGLDGDVIIDSPDRDIVGELEAVPEATTDPNKHFRNDCLAIGSGFSRFTVAKARAVQVGGSGLLPSLYVDSSDKNKLRSAADIQNKKSDGPLLVLAKNGIDCLSKRI